jgi:hypothetical protein
VAGCTTVPGYWPFIAADNTDYRTPVMRLDAVREFATKSTGQDTQEQRAITDQLARQIQIEPDPLVRRAIIATISEFRTPLAQQVLEAGLHDFEPQVRIACCEALGRRGESKSVVSLAAALRDDKDIDVRMAATDALGRIPAAESIQALRTALDSRDPALQYAGVQSMRSISGRDFGGDVGAWRQFAEGNPPAGSQATGSQISVADRLRQFSPF